MIWLYNGRMIRKWLRKNWQFIAVIAIVFFILLAIAILIYIKKAPTNFGEGYTPNLADKIYDFLDKWASAGAPAITLIGILVALCVGVAGIIQTRIFQENERKHELLNEIIEWAEKVTDWRSINKKIYKDTVFMQGGQDKEKLLYIHIIEVKEYLRGLNAKSQYITTISKIFESNLNDALCKLTSELNEYIEFLESWQHDKAEAINKNISDKKDNVDKAEEHENILDNAANRVIHTAARIKSKYVC